VDAPFRKVLVANRGEIACRIARTCRRLGIAVATVHSEADRSARHVREIGESVLLGGAASADSYLRIDRVVDAALRVGADAVHPGYGFLAENAAFADALAQAGIAFVGPHAQALRDFGDKAAAKRLASVAGVPVIPGSTQASADPREVAALVAATGLPAVLKAAAGGGGKGIRVLGPGAAIDEEIAGAMREGLGAFGDPALLVERHLPSGRHVEVQILGDGAGRVVHLWERECSLQRRHQKVVEEAPALPLPPGMRERLLDAAVALGRHVRYRALGTVEFLVVGDAFFFLEVNPRLQVEHPVTEMVTGLDLVELQLRAAAGQGIAGGVDAARPALHRARDRGSALRRRPGARVHAVHRPDRRARAASHPRARRSGCERRRYDHRPLRPHGRKARRARCHARAGGDGHAGGAVRHDTGRHRLESRLSARPHGSARGRGGGSRIPGSSTASLRPKRGGPPQTRTREHTRTPGLTRTPAHTHTVGVLRSMRWPPRRCFCRRVRGTRPTCRWATGAR
jgi:biotin carboxylase